MHEITFISTIHKEIGKCNADELCNIIGQISPEVIFLEALGDTYTKHEKFLFSTFEVYHAKAEIKAIQIYSKQKDFKYIPVLDNGLSDKFEFKYNKVCENIEFKMLVDNLNSLTSEQGFHFLNSNECIRLHDEMLLIENEILNDNDLINAVNEDIDRYENSMIKNIYSYCRNNQFDKAIFMCGSAHRKSIIEKNKYPRGN
ncbi:MAG: hypothetical protein K9H61_07610 [Bacteroidia bacterium]|nr:hypothetical protein [Bacteroidia bacterium]MCF8428293.1 hypothetical protein [Bacteroidia bacterium]MCF8446847.1 hypothetical protein [Bacteroidia bacterium]